MRDYSMLISLGSIVLNVILFIVIAVLAADGAKAKGRLELHEENEAKAEIPKVSTRY